MNVLNYFFGVNNSFLVIYLYFSHTHYLFIINEITFCYANIRKSNLDDEHITEIFLPQKKTFLKLRLCKL